jgi:hypothetical protein
MALDVALVVVVAVGKNVGIAVGRTVGIAVGIGVGIAVGKSVGIAVSRRYVQYPHPYYVIGAMCSTRTPTMCAEGD